MHYMQVEINRPRKPTRLPAKILPLHRVRQITGLTQEQFAQRIGISTALLRNLELGQRPLTLRTKKALYLLTGIEPDSWAKNKPFSTLGRPFDAKTWEYWQTVCQDENEAAPKRVTGRRLPALELLGQAMARTHKGIVWEEEFRAFLEQTMKRYGLEPTLHEIKRELEQREEKFPDDAFLPPKEIALRVQAMAQILKAQE